MFFYLFIGGSAAVLNLGIFLRLQSAEIPLMWATGISFTLAAAFNYILCILLMFRHRARWNSSIEVILFLCVVAVVGVVDYASTQFLIGHSISAGVSKILASGIGLILNFSGRKWLVFPEPVNEDWKPQNV